MTSEQLLQAWRTWAKSRLGWDDDRVRVGPSNGVVDDDPYITIQVPDGREISHVEVVRTNPSGGSQTITPRSPREWSIEINGFGPGSRAALDDLDTWIKVVDGPGKAIRDAGVVPVRTDGVRQIPSLLTTSYVERARLLVTCYADLTSGSATSDYAASLSLETTGQTPERDGPDIDLSLEPS